MARESKLESLIEPVVRGLGYELVGVELHGQGRHSLLRIYIDTPEGITVDDCERVSRQVSALLDVEDPIRGEYTLEVSSPGLDRPLFKVEDFTRFSGHEVNIRLAAPIEGRRKFKGVLGGVEDERVIVEADGERFLLPLDMIEKANLVPDV